MFKLLLKWVLQAIALMFVAYLLAGIRITDFTSALWAAAVMGLLNTVVRPILLVLTLPITILTLGLFLLVINAFMFWMAGSLLSSFAVDGFIWALLGAIVYSILSMVIDLILERKSKK